MSKPSVPILIRYLCSIAPSPSPHTFPPQLLLGLSIRIIEHHRTSQTSPAPIRQPTTSPCPRTPVAPPGAKPLHVESQSHRLQTLNVTAFVCPSVHHFVLALVSLFPPVRVIWSPARQSSRPCTHPYLINTATSSFTYRRTHSPDSRRG